MLEEFSVQNFKSLVDVTFRPRATNLLLGANNAGKTNLCLALRFLSGTTRHSLGKCAAETTGASYGLSHYGYEEEPIHLHVKATVPFEDSSLAFDYALSIGFDSFGSGPPSWGVKVEELRVNGPAFDDVSLLTNRDGHVVVLNEIDHQRGKPNVSTMTVPRDAAMLSRVYEADIHARLHCFRDYLSNWQYYDLWTPNLRMPGRGTGSPMLGSNGDNLPSVIHRLKAGSERHYREVLKCLQGFDPQIDAINFDTASGETVFMHFEDARGNTYSSERASSGTLRFLALLYVLLAQPAASRVPLILVEEPENGLYVGHLKQLLEIVDGAPNQPQLVFTSHSPYFIDLFDDRLNGVFVLKREVQQSKITQPDPDQVRRRLEEFPLGEQHFREMLA